MTLEAVSESFVSLIIPYQKRLLLPLSALSLCVCLFVCMHVYIYDKLVHQLPLSMMKFAVGVSFAVTEFCWALVRFTAQAEPTRYRHWSLFLPQKRIHILSSGSVL